MTFPGGSARPGVSQISGHLDVLLSRHARPPPGGCPRRWCSRRERRWVPGRLPKARWNASGFLSLLVSSAGGCTRPPCAHAPRAAASSKTHVDWSGRASLCSGLLPRAPVPLAAPECSVRTWPCSLRVQVAKLKEVIECLLHVHHDFTR